jgi:hypothetical protein
VNGNAMQRVRQPRTSVYAFQIVPIDGPQIDGLRIDGLQIDGPQIDESQCCRPNKMNLKVKIYL